MINSRGGASLTMPRTMDEQDDVATSSNPSGQIAFAAPSIPASGKDEKKDARPAMPFTFPLMPFNFPAFSPAKPEVKSDDKKEEKQAVIKLENIEKELNAILPVHGVTHSADYEIIIAKLTAFIDKYIDRSPLTKPYDPRHPLPAAYVYRAIFGIHQVRFDKNKTKLPAFWAACQDIREAVHINRAQVQAIILAQESSSYIKTIAIPKEYKETLDIINKSNEKLRHEIKFHLNPALIKMIYDLALLETRKADAGVYFVVAILRHFLFELVFPNLDSFPAVKKEMLAARQDKFLKGKPHSPDTFTTKEGIIIAQVRLDKLDGFPDIKETLDFLTGIVELSQKDPTIFSLTFDELIHRIKLKITPDAQEVAIGTRDTEMKLERDRKLTTPAAMRASLGIPTPENIQALLNKAIECIDGYRTKELFALLQTNPGLAQENIENHLSYQNQTLLHVAIEAHIAADTPEQYEAAAAMIDKLLFCKADPTTIIGSGHRRDLTAYLLAVHTRNDEVLQLLAKYHPVEGHYPKTGQFIGRTLLMHAVHLHVTYADKSSHIEFILNETQNMNCRINAEESKEHGFTALRFAIHNNKRLATTALEMLFKLSILKVTAKKPGLDGQDVRAYMALAKDIPKFKAAFGTYLMDITNASKYANKTAPPAKKVPAPAKKR